MLRLLRAPAPALALSLGVSLAPACSGDSTATVSSAGTGTSSGTSGTASGTSGASGTASGSGSGTDASTSGTTSGSGSGSGSTTGALPPECTRSSDCPGQGKCLLKPCDAVMNEAGCGAFRCYEDCSDPIVGDPWQCADAAACCGGYPCMAGMCTEEVTTG